MINVERMNDVHAISDLGLGTALCCLGFHITKLDRSNPRRIVFCFEEKEGFEDAVNAYWGGTLKLSPLNLFTHQKQLKQRIYALHD